MFSMRCTAFRSTLLVLLTLIAVYPEVWARPLSLSVLTNGAQSSPTAPARLPAADKIVAAYLKAIGGKKRVAAIRDATFEWTVEVDSRSSGVATTQTRAPASFRSAVTLATGQELDAANAGSAWTRGPDGKLRTLTGDEATAARLQALLQASQLVDYKKRNVLARVLFVGELESEPAYVVEFSTRNGARLRFWFKVSSKLLVKVEDHARQITTSFSDYRPQAAMANVLQPHRVSIRRREESPTTFLLQRATFNQGLTVSAFDPPRAAETVDVVKLLREVSNNQDELEKRFDEYAFFQKETDREINGKGEVKKETVKVFEVFPIANRAAVMKLISENGVKLSGERLAKETRRVEEEFEKAGRDQEKESTAR